MRKQDRLSALEMSVARHDHFAIFRRAINDRLLQFDDQSLNFSRLTSDVQMHVERDLIISRASGVESAARLADPISQCLLDVHMNVFELDTELELAAIDLRADLLQAVDDLIAIVVGDDVLSGEHFRMRDRAFDVLTIQPLIESNRRLEFIDHLVRRLLETPAPEFSVPISHNSLLRTENRSTPSMPRPPALRPRLRQ